MGLLQQVIRGRQPAPRRVMVYGVQGVGKSTFGASARRPIFIQTEDGLGEIESDKFPLAMSTADVIAAIGELHGSEHDYQSVVLDSVDWLELMIWDDVCREYNAKHLEKVDGGYGKGYAYTLPHWRTVLDGFDALRRDRQMTIVLLAHAKSEKFQTPEDTAHDRYAPRLHKLASALIQEWCDEVFFATYTAITDPKKVKVGEPPERIMRTCEGPTHVAKNRLGMPPELPLLWDAYDYYIHQTHSTATQGEMSNG